MTRDGSFFRLPREMPSCQPVLFAYVLDTPEQREALEQEILDRVTAIQELCGTQSMARLDGADRRSHFGMVEAVALLSRDVRGMLDAYFDNGPQVHGCRAASRRSGVCDGFRTDHTAPRRRLAVPHLHDVRVDIAGAVQHVGNICVASHGCSRRPRTAPIRRTGCTKAARNATQRAAATGDQVNFQTPDVTGSI